MKTMRRVHAVMAVLALSAFNGCGKDASGDAKVAVVSQNDAVQRLAMLERSLHAWQDYGFELNETEPWHYRVKIKNAHKAVNTFLNLFGLQAMQEETKESLYRWLTGARFDMSVDKSKYLRNEADSVYVAYLGRGNEPKAWRDLFLRKKIGAYLTLAKDNRVRRVRLRDIDETILDGGKRVHWVWKGASLDIDSLEIAVDTPKRYRFNGGDTTIESSDENNNTLTFSYNRFECDVNLTKPYLGTYRCEAPAMSIEGDTAADASHFIVTLTQGTLDSTTSKHQGFLKTQTLLRLQHIDGHYKEGRKTNGNEFDVTLDGLALHSSSDEVNETAVATLSAMQHRLDRVTAAEAKETMRVVGRILSHMSFDVNVTLDALRAQTPLVDINVTGYAAQGVGAMKQTIRYRENDTIASFNIVDKIKRQPIVSLEQFGFGYALEDVKNFLPNVMRVAGEITASELNASLAVSPQDIEEALRQTATDVIHHGFALKAGPVGWKALTFQNQNAPTTMGALHGEVTIKLSPNRVPVDFNNPLSGMMLINALSANGKLIFKQKDLQTVARLLPPQAGMMLMMFAKQQGDEVVYVLEFKNGMLSINGQPLM